MSLVEYLSNFYVNFEYNLFFMLIRIEIVDILGINRELLLVVINFNIGDSCCIYFLFVVIFKCVNYSIKL